MKIKEIMSSPVAYCMLDTPLREVALMMAECQCGEIPVCDDARKPIGVVTDRDIVCRLVARGDNPLEFTAVDCMSQPVIRVAAHASLEEGARLMEQYRVRRLPVVDANGVCCGIVAQADLATCAPRHLTAAVVAEVSKPSASAGSAA
jgi:CBS domain-containing protein